MGGGGEAQWGFGPASTAAAICTRLPTMLRPPPPLSSLPCPCPAAVAASLLGVLFVFALGTVLVNLTISIMTNSLDKVRATPCLLRLLPCLLSPAVPAAPCVA